MENITLQVKGMSCNHCVQSVEGALETIGAKGKVDLDKGAVEVEFNESVVSLETIKEAIEDQGYDVV